MIGGTSGRCKLVATTQLRQAHSPTRETYISGPRGPFRPRSESTKASSHTWVAEYSLRFPPLTRDISSPPVGRAATPHRPLYRSLAYYIARGEGAGRVLPPPPRSAAAATHSPTSPLPFHSSSSSDREAERAIPQGDFLLLFSHLPPSSPLRESVVWFVVDYLS